MGLKPREPSTQVQQSKQVGDSPIPVLPSGLPEMLENNPRFGQDCDCLADTPGTREAGYHGTPRNGNVTHRGGESFLRATQN
jgi:hypothetical protein